MSSISFAQETEVKKDPLKEDIYTIVESMPDFPGGQEAMFKFIGENIVYPKKAKKQGIEGRVYVNFIVEKDGSISNVKVVRGVHELLDKEAIRMVKSFPKWNPGFQRGKAVRVSYNLPLSFKMKTPTDKKNKNKKK